MMYALLGLRLEDEEADKAREAARKVCGEQNDDTWEVDTTGAAIDVDDYLPGERTVVHDPNRPRMDLGTVYPNMKEFRLVVRQFAINEEFELHIVKIDPNPSNDQVLAPAAPNPSNAQVLAPAAPNALSSPTRLTREQIL